MGGTGFDVIIGSTKARVLRGENQGYRRRTLRQQVETNLLSQSQNAALSSRADEPSFYQDSWAGGSRWWKPIMTGDQLDSYFQSNHMDLWSEPGKVVPTNKVVDAANTSLHDNCVIATDSDGDVYAIGSTANVNAAFLDVYKWTPASDAFVQETGYHSGVPVAEDPVDMIFDPNDGYFYVINPDGDEVTRFNPTTPAQDAAWLSPTTWAPGVTLALHREGILIFDNRIRLVDKTALTAAVVVNDGMSLDLLRDLDLTGTAPLIRRINTIVSTPEGLYYFKNTASRGQITAWVFRVEKDAAGNWIGSPIATLPTGTAALSIAYHLGNIIVAATPDYRTIIQNDTQEAEIILYFVSSDAGMGAIGSLLGGREELDETPHALLGSSGPLLYIGGQKRLWVYDAIRGGLHPAWEWATESTDGGYVRMAFVEDSDGDSAMIFLAKDRIARVKTAHTDDPDTVTAFGDDETHYTLESNYFDFGLPMETKEITKVAILRDKDDGGSEWTVQLAADDGAFADVLTDSGTAAYKEATLSGTTGRKFRYKLIYQTKDTARKALTALRFTANSGEMVTEWDLTLDGTEFLNLDNEVMDEEAFYDAMKTLGDTSSITTLVDNYQEQGQLTDSATKVNVRVIAVEIVKEKPGESAVRVVLREA